MATSFWARCSAVWDITREPVKRQMMITLAKPSIAESRPKPTSAIEPAMMPATSATIALDAHHPEREPRQQPHPTGELAVALGEIVATGRAAGAAGTASGSSTGALMRSPAGRGDGGKQRAAAVGELVHDHLALAARHGQAGGTQRTDMVGHELLVARDDPREVADARAPLSASAIATRQPGRVTERLRAAAQSSRPARRQAAARRLGLW